MRKLLSLCIVTAFLTTTLAFANEDPEDMLPPDTGNAPMVNEPAQLNPNSGVVVAKKNKKKNKKGKKSKKGKKGKKKRS